MEVMYWSTNLLVSSFSVLVILAIGFVMMFLITGILNLIKYCRKNK